MNTNMLLVFAYLFNWYTPFVERHARKRVLFREGLDGRIRFQTPDQEDERPAPYTRTRNSDHLGAWDMRTQLERSE